MFTVSFLKEGVAKFRGWLDQLLASSWTACEGTDVLIESPSTMAGCHVAEALQIPYYRAFTMRERRSWLVPLTLADLTPLIKPGQGPERIPMPLQFPMSRWAEGTIIW